MRDCRSLDEGYCGAVGKVNGGEEVIGNRAADDATTEDDDVTRGIGTHAVALWI